MTGSHGSKNTSARVTLASHSSINTAFTAAYLVKSLAKDNHCSIGTLKLPSGAYTNDVESTQKHLLEFHFPDSSVSNQPTPVSTPSYLIPIGDRHVALSIVSEGKVKLATESFVPIKSPEEDNVIPIMLQYSIHLIIDILYELFVASIHLAYIPRAWRGVRVAFIPKLGQAIYTVAKAFRPISLTSIIMLKMLEKIVDRYLDRDGILQEFPIHSKQHAYQPCKSAESALHNIANKVEGALEQDNFALTGLIDLSNAFSNMTFMT